VSLIGGAVLAHRLTAPLSVTAHLDRYLRGDFDAVVAELTQLEKLDDVLDQLKGDGVAWVNGGDPSERPRRVLTAATYALEAGRTGAFAEWKWVQLYGPNPERPEMGTGSIYWKPPPLLIEWGCALLRAQTTPSPHERNWHLAAVSAAQLAGDFEFLIGSPFEARGNPQDEIEHLTHAIARVPNEPRLALAQAIAVEWTTFPNPPRAGTGRPRQTTEAIRAFEPLTRDESIRAEATLRLGSLRLRGGRPADALELFSRVETLTRERYLAYLARYFSGQAHEQLKQPADAERAYRGALKTIPDAQSAAFRLGALLFLVGRPADAAAVTESALSTQPQPIDPWREYGTADNRFWPVLIGRLRAAILD
jgi:tetratricopeptide (TPR) repeat protein